MKDSNVRINGINPVDVRINGKPILAIMINDTRVWPVDADTPTDIDIDVALSCFGMGMWLDSLTWNDNAIWSD